MTRCRKVTKIVSSCLWLCFTLAPQARAEGWVQTDLPITEVRLSPDILEPLAAAKTAAAVAALLRQRGVPVLVTDKIVSPELPDSVPAETWRLSSDERLLPYYDEWFSAWPAVPMHYLHAGEGPEDRPGREEPLVLVAKQIRRDLLVRAYLKHEVFRAMDARGEITNPEIYKRKLLLFIDESKGLKIESLLTAESQVDLGLKEVAHLRRRLRHTRLVLGSEIDVTRFMAWNAAALGLDSGETANTLRRLRISIDSYLTIYDQVLTQMDVSFRALTTAHLIHPPLAPTDVYESAAPLVEANQKKYPDAVAVEENMRVLMHSDLAAHLWALNEARAFVEPRLSVLPRAERESWAY